MRQPPPGLRLFERAREVAHIERAMTDACSGHGTATLFEGPAGSGKTELLRVVDRWAVQDEMLILGARATESEREFPWGVAAALFRPVLERFEAEEAFAGAASLARALFTPSPGPPAPFPDPFPLLHGLYWLTVNLSQRAPMVMIVDDAQWADAESLQFLHYLLERLEGLPLAAFIGSRDPDTADGRAADLLARLTSRTDLTLVALKRLTDASIERLVREELPGADDAFCAAIVADVAGDPFHARRICEAARSAGISPEAGNVEQLRALHSRDMHRVIEQRLETLGEDALRMASSYAVLSGSANPQRAGELAGLGEERAARALDLLVRSDVLTAGARLTFTHPIVAEVLSSGLDPERRREENLRAARLLHAEGAPADEIARHLFVAGPSGEAWAPQVLHDAGRIAWNRGAAVAAAELLRRAYDEAPGGEENSELLLELGRAEAALGDPSAFSRLEIARDTARDPGHRIAASAAIGLTYYAAGRSVEAAAEIRSALEAIPPGLGGTPEGDLIAVYGAASRAIPELIDPLTEFLSTPRAAPDGSTGAAEHARLTWVAFDTAVRGDLAAARLAARVAMRANTAAVAPYSQVVLSIVAGLLGRYDEARRLAAPLVAAAQTRGDRLMLASGVERNLYANWLSGRVTATIADCETIIELSEGRWDQAVLAARVVHALALWERDEAAAATQALSVPEEAEEHLGHAWAGLWLPWGRALLALNTGDPREAAEQAELLGDRLLAAQMPSPVYHPWRSLAARARHRLGDVARACELIEEEERLARSTGSDRAIGVALLARGELRDDREALHSALEHLERSDCALEIVRARIALGRSLRLAGETAAARDLLGEAADLASRLGAVRAAGEAHDELRATGARPRRLRLSGVEALTPGQRRVAELAAAGATNREIAESLFLTVHTVEAHLTAAYAKLAIGSRAELPAVLARAGDTGPVT